MWVGALSETGVWGFGCALRYCVNASGHAQHELHERFLAPTSRELTLGPREFQSWNSSTFERVGRKLLDSEQHLVKVLLFIMSKG